MIQRVRLLVLMGILVFIAAGNARAADCVGTAAEYVKHFVWRVGYNENKDPAVRRVKWAVENTTWGLVMREMRADMNARGFTPDSADERCLHDHVIAAPDSQKRIAEHIQYWGGPGPTAMILCQPSSFWGGAVGVSQSGFQLNDVPGGWLAIANLSKTQFTYAAWFYNNEGTPIVSCFYGTLELRRDGRACRPSGSGWISNVCGPIYSKGGTFGTLSTCGFECGVP